MEWREHPTTALKWVLVDDGKVAGHVVRLNRRGGGHVWTGTVDRRPRQGHETGPCDTLAEAQAAVEELVAGRRRRFTPRDERWARRVDNAPVRAPHPGTLRRPPR